MVAAIFSIISWCILSVGTVCWANVFSSRVVAVLGVAFEQLDGIGMRVALHLDIGAVDRILAVLQSVDITLVLGVQFLRNRQLLLAGDRLQLGVGGAVIVDHLAGRNP